MFGIPFDLDQEETNKHGLDKLQLLIHFLGVLEGENPKKQYHSLKIYLKSKINRRLTMEEELDLTKGIYNYLETEPESNERIKSINYIINAEFLHSDEQIKTTIET